MANLMHDYSVIQNGRIVQKPQDVIVAHDMTDSQDMEVNDFADPDQLTGNRQIIMACVELLSRCGANWFGLRVDESIHPFAWVATARWDNRWEATAGLSAEQAMFRLLQEAVDGGLCVHCEKPVGLVRAFEEELDPEHICWYQMDPELGQFRRSCEGDDDE